MCKILLKSEQICACCCKMLRGSLFLGHTVCVHTILHVVTAFCQLLNKRICHVMLSKIRAIITSLKTAFTYFDINTPEKECHNQVERNEKRESPT